MCLNNMQKKTIVWVNPDWLKFAAITPPPLVFVYFPLLYMKILAGGLTPI